MKQKSQLESILFVASAPLSFSAIAKALLCTKIEAEALVVELQAAYNTQESGIHLFVVDDEVRMGTNPDNAILVESFVKDEVAGELTKAQLETLTVVAYRGPITRPELEEIRGVNCAVILRTLLIRGLVIEHVAKEAQLSSTYVLSHEALAHLGVHSTEELPDYQVLHTHPHIEAALDSSNSV